MASLRDLDLNLLKALNALLTEQSVTRAAEREGMTQPAMSQALARLRKAFDDPLLVRAGRGMTPTALAVGLGPTLHVLLTQLDDLLREGGSFVPESTTRIFRAATLDHFSALHLPDLVAAMHATAPLANIVATQLSYDSVALALERGTVDVGIGVFGDSPAAQIQRKLHEERFMCIVRRGHPALSNWGVESFVAHPHGLLSTTGRGTGAVDEALQLLGRRRRVAVRVPHFLAAGALAASTDLIFTVASRLADWFAKHHDVVCAEPPIELPGYAVVMRWHRRAHHDPAHRWFRDRVVECAK